MGGGRGGGGVGGGVGVLLEEQNKEEDKEEEEDNNKADKTKSEAMKRDESRRQDITWDAKGSHHNTTEIKGKVETKSNPKHKHTHGGTSKVLVNHATTVRGNNNKTNACSQPLFQIAEN